MTNWDTGAARAYHERTKHSYASVRQGARPLAWDVRPQVFKDYRGADVVELPVERPEWPQLSLAALGWLLRYGAGVSRSRTVGGATYHFRTYSSAGALYPVEVYVAWPGSAELGAGLYAFDARRVALVRLRRGDPRPHLDREAARREATLVLTGMLWRTAWKYGERGYRHLWWDAGTMLANVLALAASVRVAARLLTGFVDRAVNEVLGVDGSREAALALVALGEPVDGGEELGPLEVEHPPRQRGELSFPEAASLHAASALERSDEVERYRGPPGEAAEPWPPDVLEQALLRRGSIRDFAPAGIAEETLAAVLAAAAAAVPADVPPFGEAYVVANEVEGRPAGAYRFEPQRGLELIRDGDFRAHAGYLVLEQPLGALAAATLFFMADLEHVLERHGNRGYRWAQLEAGIRTGRVYIGAFAAGLGATASTFYDDDVSRFFGTSASPMLCAAVGRRPQRR